MTTTTKLEQELKEIGEIMANNPRNSAKFKKALKRLEAIVGPEEPEGESDDE